MLQQDVLNLNTFGFHPSSNCVCLKQNTINWIRMMTGRTATKIFTLFEKHLIQRRLSSNFQVAVAAFCNRATSICNPPCRRMPSYTVSFCGEKPMPMFSLICQTLSRHWRLICYYCAAHPPSPRVHVHSNAAEICDVVENLCKRCCLQWFSAASCEPNARFRAQLNSLRKQCAINK